MPDQILQAVRHVYIAGLHIVPFLAMSDNKPMSEDSALKDPPRAHRGGMTLEQLRVRRGDILRGAAAHDATNVRIFGSVARGEADARSDVDFLVDVPPECRGFDFFGVLDELREALEALLGCKVDVVSIRGIAPQTQAIADQIRREAVLL